MPVCSNLVLFINTYHHIFRINIALLQLRMESRIIRHIHYQVQTVVLFISLQQICTYC